jgi:protein MpaA
MVMSNQTTEVYPHKLRRLYWPFLALAESCENIVGMVAGSFSLGGNRYTLPRFTLLGPQTSVPQKRIGIFGLLHGDEAACALALLQLLQALVNDPEPAKGYDLVIYPVCNPTGYEDGTRNNRNGYDLNREFWRGSSQPEVRILEAELRSQSFDGIIALHADDTCDGLYGYTQGRVLNENLLQPALHASTQVLPLDRRPTIDNFNARDGMIGDCFPGILRPPPDQKPQPFEIIFETPAHAAPEKQAEAARVAILSILTSYRGFIAYAQDL